MKTNDLARKIEERTHLAWMRKPDPVGDPVTRHGWFGWVRGRGLSVVLGLLLLAPPDFAPAISLAALISRADSAAQATNFTLAGKITQSSPGKLTISTEANIIFHVRHDDKTEIKRQDGSKGSAKDLRVGVKVRIEGDLTETGEVVAQKIEIEPDSEKH